MPRVRPIWECHMVGLYRSEYHVLGVYQSESHVLVLYQSEFNVLGTYKSGHVFALIYDIFVN
jgi:hypothetical protein